MSIRISVIANAGGFIVETDSIIEPHRDKTNKMACAPSEDSDQPGHSPSLLIRVFAARLKKARILSYPLIAQRRLWSDWADAQVDLSLRWAHMPFCWFCHDAAQLWRLFSQNKHCRKTGSRSAPACQIFPFECWEYSIRITLQCTLISLTDMFLPKSA